jgi:hypothetical protein
MTLQHRIFRNGKNYEKWPRQATLGRGVEPTEYKAGVPTLQREVPN